MNKKKVLRWEIALIALLLLLLGLWVAFSVAGGSGMEGSVAVVRLDGEELYRIDLDEVEEAYEIPVDTEYGHNTILVEPGQISVISADCPDGICVAQGVMKSDGLPIVCLPHRLSITMEKRSVDA